MSNIAIFNPASSKKDKVSIAGEGKDKHRVFKSDGSKVDS
jgi:hypothetical protein